MDLIREAVIIAVPFLALILLGLSFKFDEKKLPQMTPEQERKYEIDPDPVYDPSIQ